jgi:hypothetical protein
MAKETVICTYRVRAAAEDQFEIFSWVDGGFARAHEHPDVLVLWERMDPLLEERNGRPKWEFPHYLPQDLPA